MYRVAHFAAATIACTFSIAAPADQPSVSPWYASLATGVAHLQDSLTGFPNQDRLPYEFGYETGIAWSLAGGYRLGPHWRLELEGTGRNHLLGSSSPAGSEAEGRLQVSAAMANVYRDFEPFGPWRPYVGLGVGLADVGLKGYSVNGAPLVNDRERAAAFQVIGGIRYDIDERWALTADYRYFRTSDPLMNSVAGDVMETSIRSHAIMFGVTRALGR
jgi:opacity protein-like surface antigen